MSDDLRFIGGCIGAWLGDGLEVFLRICVLAIVVLWGSALIAWVTPTAALAGALRVYVRPLRFFGAPVGQWSLVMASALRGLPMLRDQAQAVLDTAKLRLGRDIATLSPGGYVRLSVDVITAVLSATSRGRPKPGEPCPCAAPSKPRAGAVRARPGVAPGSDWSMPALSLRPCWVWLASLHAR